MKVSELKYGGGAPSRVSARRGTARRGPLENAAAPPECIRADHPATRGRRALRTTMSKFESSGTSSICVEQLLPVASETDILEARRAVRAFATLVGFARADLVILTAAVTEILRNMLEHYALDRPASGHVALSLVENDARRGVQIVVTGEDAGIGGAMWTVQDGSPNSDRLGLGVSGSRRLVDEFDVESNGSAVTTVTMRKWLA
jgi:serine/threonine-protein kinase RsbT